MGGVCTDEHNAELVGFASVHACHVNGLWNGYAHSELHEVHGVCMCVVGCSFATSMCDFPSFVSL